MFSAPSYLLPDLLLTWPYQRVLNDDLDDVQSEANSWVKALGLFEPRQYQKFEACNFARLAALVGPLESKERLRAACDLMHFYFAFDEYTDLASKEEAMKISATITDVFLNKELHQESGRGLIDMARQFFERTKSVIGEDPTGIWQFISDFEAYTRAVAQEAEDRDHGCIRTVQDYLKLRRDTSGAKPSFTFFTLGLNIPSEVYEHPKITALVDSAADLISVTNDMHSYGLEHSRGLDGHNVLTAIMNEYNIGLQTALHFLSDYATKTISKFLSDRESLPSWGPKVDGAVQRYIDLMGRCVRGYDAWSYETNRYYGTHGLEIQHSRILTLKPRDNAYLTREEFEVSMAH